MRWLFAGATGEAMRDGDLGLNAAGCGEELQCDECSKDEFAEVHCF